ncbi:MAG: hypothetical protein ABIG43_03040 [Chloroflexota bacterium]
MRTLRASELGSYLYCQRAWWYQKQGVESRNLAEMAGGTQLHRAHGRRLVLSGLMRILAWVLMLAGLVLLVFILTTELL